MKALLLLLVALACLALAVDFKREAKILVVTDQNYELVVNSSKYLVLVFYAPHNDVATSLLANL